ncbi:spinocerebellar ataxia type 10 protein domain-containing protein [Phyllosticta citriasiana]|uniref:spinocerebellar ataxia type 10 protein domain-containing protein n=1 Tax=Phyllosticta citriasiana TaxID=595635 RepID=UPI0030FDDA8A
MSATQNTSAESHHGGDSPAPRTAGSSSSPNADDDTPRLSTDPWAVELLLILNPWIIHFKSPGYIMPYMMEKLDSMCKKTLKKTVKDEETRYSIGSSPKIWQTLSELLQSAVPSLETRSFAPPDPAAPEFEGASVTLIASNYSTLMKDLERLIDLVSIGRNSLTIGEDAQELAAKMQFDSEIFKLTSVCVKATARGFDGDAGTQDGTRWQDVINSYKKLLITSLQFLNNLVARNERRKLMLWVELFDGSPEGAFRPGSRPPFETSGLTTTPEQDWSSVPYSDFTAKAIKDLSMGAGSGSQQRASSPFLLYIGKIGMDVKRALLAKGEKAGATEIAAECKKRWQEMPQESREEWHLLYNDLMTKYRQDASLLKSIKPPSELKPVDPNASQEENVAALAASINQLQLEVDRMKKALLSSKSKMLTYPSAQPKITPTDVLKRWDIENFPLTTRLPESPAASEADFRMAYSAAYGANILQEGKDDLMKRLETFPERVPVQRMPEASPSSPVSDEEDSEDDDYVVSGDDGRGLLTDVPLILAPSEIEVLPMIIMSGIVPPPEGASNYGVLPDEISAIKNMHTVRCHLLLAQDNGRNLLRELLIFVAAWDLREDELYFKFMVKITEAVLMNGLLPFSYHAFRETKDIISPAQGVIMKLLTNIFKTRQNQAVEAAKDHGDGQGSSYPLRVDVHMVNFLFTEFRRHIIPQTCALIFLQGQIKAGHAHPEDFPLNLWDMERMYEGVYQYLEFFAILTEHDVWKKMMADWEITSELITLLKELDSALPKQTLLARRPPTMPDSNRSASPQPPPGSGPAPVAVERPYDVSGPPLAADQFPAPSSSSGQYVEDPSEEPSDFEWRNLKKLTVLVLTSLVWKSRKVQDQVRAHGGVEAILNCCQYDEGNPYIKEHAIMCLRFLLEGNKENQDVIRELEPQGVVPNEVLDHHGYETFWDQHGQVSLRRKEVEGERKRPPQIGSGQANLDLLMQQVMRDLPATVQGARRDAEKAAALAKLDKTFKK